MTAEVEQAVAALADEWEQRYGDDSIDREIAELRALLPHIAAERARAWDEGEAATLHNRRVMAGVIDEPLRINPHRARADRERGEATT